LHEYVQQSLKSQPVYTFTELENAATPYEATVTINQIQYGREVGSSKRLAKARAARWELVII
jgi:microprocessor complex subunit DGCR8